MNRGLISAGDWQLLAHGPPRNLGPRCAKSLHPIFISLNNLELYGENFHHTSKRLLKQPQLWGHLLDQHRSAVQFGNHGKPYFVCRHLSLVASVMNSPSSPRIPQDWSTTSSRWTNRTSTVVGVQLNYLGNTWSKSQCITKNCVMLIDPLVLVCSCNTLTTPQGYLWKTPQVSSPTHRRVQVSSHAAEIFHEDGTPR